MKRLIDWLRPRGYHGELLVGPLEFIHPASLLYNGAVFAVGFPTSLIHLFKRRK